MRLSVLQENFSPALNNVSRFVSGKTQLPILNNILLATDHGRLKLSATNLELGINYWIGAKIESEGSTTLPAREITEFISYLPPGRLDLELNDHSLFTAKLAKFESQFASTPSADFPLLPLLDQANSFELDLSLFSEAISQVSFSAATEDTRPVLTAVVCQFTPNGFNLIATDGFRLSIKNVKLVNPLKLKSNSDLTFLIPARTLIEVVKFAKNNKTITLGPTSDGHQFLFVLEAMELVSRLIEGDFPDYQRIIPTVTNTKITLDKDDFIQAIKISSVFARESANVVKMKVMDKSIELTANALQVGQNRASIEAKVDGNPLEIAFNFKFISDFLTVCHGKDITLELNEPLTPGIFRDTSNPDFTHIIMPVRIQD